MADIDDHGVARASRGRRASQVTHAEPARLEVASMEKPGSRTRVLALAGLFVLTTIGMAIWVGVTVRRDGSIDSRSGERPTLTQHPNPTAPDSTNTRTPLADEPAAPPDKSATGRLHIHCIDATTGVDLAGMAWVAGMEGAEDRLLSTGTTDASGHAMARDLPAGTILVFTLRHPPHAQSFTAVRLSVGESKEVELRVGNGGRVQGRVVDDLDHPLADAEVMTNADYAPPFLKAEHVSLTTKVAARTDAEGHYVIDCLASRPGGVRVDESGARAEYWREVVIQARLGGSMGSTLCAIRAGESQTAEDIVLQRERAWRGRVVDSSGRGVEGALLSVNMDRIGEERLARGIADDETRIPGRPGFNLLSGETLTGPDGEFVLASPSAVLYLARVIEITGVSQYVHLPSLSAGQTTDDVLIRLKAGCVVTLDLVDANGARARVPNPRLYPSGPGTRSSAYWFFMPIKLAFTFDDGSVRTAELHDDGVGGFIAQVDERIELARSCSLGAAGWSRKSVQLVPRLVSGGTLHLVLDEQPCLRVHLRIHGATTGISARERAGFRIHACLLSADVLAAGKVQCCGLGSTSDVDLEEVERDILLPVESQRTFHVFTEAYGPVQGSKIVDRGACSPGGEPLTIDIDAAEFLPTPPANDSAMPEDADSKTPAATGSVRVTVVDAATGAPVHWPRLELEQAGKRFTCYSTSGLTIDKGIAKERVPVGSWKGAVYAEGYEGQQDINVDVSERSTTDLGRIALTPRPSTRFVIQDADGSPIPAHMASLQVRSLDGSKYYGMGSLEHEDGSFILHGTLPDRVLVRIGADMGALQWTEVAVDPKETVVRLEAWHDVDVRIGGAARDLPHSNLKLTVRQESLGMASMAPGTVMYELASARPLEIDVPPGEPRLFRCRLGAGKYVIEGESPLFHVTSRTIEIRDGEGPVRVDVESTE